MITTTTTTTTTTISPPASAAACIGRGLFLSAANVMAVSWTIGAIEAIYEHRAHFDASELVVQFGIVPALLTGLVCGLIARYARRNRELLVIGVALTAVLVLGIALDPGLIPLGFTTTVPLALALCHWTRRADDPVWHPSNATKGAVLGVATVLATAAILGTIIMMSPPHLVLRGGSEPHWMPAAHSEGGELGELIAIIGMLPGIFIGLGLGAFADTLHNWRRATRILVLGTLAVSGVALLGTLTVQAEYIAPACMPALLAVAVLEHWTLRRGPAMPDARALHGVESLRCAAHRSH